MDYRLGVLLMFGLLAGAGVGFVTLSWRQFERARAFASRAVRTEGTVVDVLERREHNSSTNSWVTSYSAVVSYTDVSGKVDTYSGSSWTTWKPRVGRKVRLLLDPRDPEYVARDTLFSLWGIPAIVGLIGLGLLVGAYRMSLLWD